MSKKKGHHGGAWKVAYADFVTAMMALFMVMWLTSQDQRIKEAVERAFRNPFSSVTKESVGIIPTKEMQALKSSSGNFDSAAAIELTMLRRLNQDLLKSLQTEAETPAEKSVQIDLVSDELRINVFDRVRKPIFEPRSTTLTAYGNWIFSTLAWEIARYPGFSLQLEGHTESGQPPVGPDYGEWELSTDRATAVRRELLAHGVRAQQIKKVAGFGDTVPMSPDDPSGEINNRVTVLLNVKSVNTL